MPNGNGTDPVGAGPMTGRGAGGRGMQRGGRGGGTPRGFFRNHAQHAVASANAMMLQEKIDALQAQINSLQQQLADITGQTGNN